MPNGKCPDCDADVHIDPIEDKGNTLLCEECGAELEIVGLRLNWKSLKTIYLMTTKMMRMITK